MSNELIGVFDTDALPANPNQLKEFARKKAVFIAQRVHNLTQNLEKAKKLSAEAENAKTDWKHHTSNFLFRGLMTFGKSASEKRSEINTEIIILQNEAITELANLVQESIQFAATSAVLNQAMLE